MGFSRRTTVILNLPVALLLLSLFWLNTSLVSAQSCTSTPITSGSPVNGSLTDSDCAAPHRQSASGGGPAKADLYTFTGTAGQSVTITMNRASLNDPYLILVGPNGTVVEEDDDDGGNNNALITRSLPSAGTYTIEATAYRSRDRGAYTVTVSGDGGGGGGGGGGPAVSPSTDNYFITHGRVGNYTQFQDLLTYLEARVNDPNSRYFLVDWSAAAASNYPVLRLEGLQGSRFIIPAGRALKELVISGQRVPASKITVWGHSWGSYVSSEFAKASGSHVKALVALDPAELNSTAWILGNAYSQPSLRERATHSFALVARHGLYGGEGEADTADLSVRITAKKPNGDTLGDNDPLHSVPIRCMEYALHNLDAVSEALVRGALWQPGPRDRTIVDQDPDHPDATMDGHTDDSGNNYTGHGPLTNGSVTISP